MKKVLTNTTLAIVFSLLAYLPFSVYKFDNIKDIASDDKVLSATSDNLGRYVSFGEKEKVKEYETAVFKVFLDKQVEYTDFYSITNNSDSIKEYKVLAVNFDSATGFNLKFTSTGTDHILVKPNETVGLTVSFQPTSTQNTTLSFLVLEKALYPKEYNSL